MCYFFMSITESWCFKMGEENEKASDVRDAERVKTMDMRTRILGGIFGVFEMFVAVIVVVVMVITFLFRTVGVEGESMMYTLKDKDRLVISNFLYTPAVGDIVVLNLPDKFNVPIIKRIIATEGQMLNITTGGDVYVDGQKREESYVHDKTVRKNYNLYPLKVPQGCIFVMGDNRMHSADSRDVGCVSVKNIVGRAILRVLPLNSLGTL